MLQLPTKAIDAQGVSNPHATFDSCLNVAIEQPSLAKYRIPVFRELARRPGLNLTVYYSKAPSLPNVPADGFRAKFVPSRRYAVGSRRIIWNGSCWRNAAKNSTKVLVLNWI